MVWQIVHDEMLLDNHTHVWVQFVSISISDGKCLVKRLNQLIMIAKYGCWKFVVTSREIEGGRKKDGLGLLWLIVSADYYRQSWSGIFHFSIFSDVFKFRIIINHIIINFKARGSCSRKTKLHKLKISDSSMQKLF